MDQAPQDKLAKNAGSTWGILETLTFGLLGFGISTIATIAVAILAIAFAGEKIIENLGFNLIVLIFTNLVFLAVILTYLIGKKVKLSQLGLRKPKSSSNWFLVIPTFFAYAGVLFVADTALRYFLPELNLDQEQELVFKNAAGIYQMIIAGIALLVVAPVTEELIFRGFIFKGFRNKLGFLLAAIISSALFGIAHGQLNVAVDTFILGMFLCFLYEKSKSIWLPIALHAFKNGIAFYLIFFTSL